MSSLGKMVRSREETMEGLNDLVKNLDQVIFLSSNLLRDALAVRSAKQGQYSQLVRSLGYQDHNEVLLVNNFQKIENQKNQTVKDIKFWIDISFDNETRTTLEKRLFPKRSMFIAGGDAASSVGELDREAKKLLEELEDIRRRIPYFSVPNVPTSESSVPVVELPSDNTQPSKDSIFVAYSHKDTKWLTRIMVHLRPAVRENRIDVWNDTFLKIGTRWRNDIKSALNTSSISILLVSADFLASDFISGVELPSLLHSEEENGLLIIPIFISPCDVPEIITAFQGLNSPDHTFEQMQVHESEAKMAELARMLKK